MNNVFSEQFSRVNLPICLVNSLRCLKEPGTSNAASPEITIRWMANGRLRRKVSQVCEINLTPNSGAFFKLFIFFRTVLSPRSIVVVLDSALFTLVYCRENRTNAFKWRKSSVDPQCPPIGIEPTTAFASQFWALLCFSYAWIVDPVDINRT